MATTTPLEFDGWSVNRVSGEISRAGRDARLPQQPLRILFELADRAGEIVTREQLVKVLWPQGIVDFDNGLNVAMRKLRVALDDVGATPRYIETLPKVGYRFIGRMGAPPAPPLPQRPARSTRLVLIFTLLALGIALGVSWWWNAFVANPDPATHHVPSVRAQELYLEGLHQRSRRDVDASPQAREKFAAA